MKIKVQKINDPDVNVEISSPSYRIEKIKSDILNCQAGELCKIEVYNMWDDLPE